MIVKVIFLASYCVAESFFLPYMVDCLCHHASGPKSSVCSLKDFKAVQCPLPHLRVYPKV